MKDPSSRGADPTWQVDLEADTHQTTAFESKQAPGRWMIPGLTVLFHPDLNRVGERVGLPELVSSRSVRLSRLEPELKAPGGSEKRPLANRHLSRSPIELRGVAEGVAVDRAEHRGRVTVNGVPLAESAVVPLGLLENGVVLTLSKYVALLLHWLDPSPSSLPNYGLVGESPAMARLRREIHRVARLDVPVLIRGESGSGKELIAQAIHRSSSRASRPCVSVNMAAIPQTLAASELFGAVKGAFTGADRNRTGFFQQADRGTLFLDEIGETPTDVQALLLRALESQEIQPVGADVSRKVDVRVIAATDADLDSAVESGDFRVPLIHRLAGYEIHSPPLRQRRDDIARLLIHFVRSEVTAIGGSAAGSSEAKLPNFLSLDLMIGLVLFDWPGNVRQLRNVTRRLAILSTEGTLDLRSSIEEMLGRPLPDGVSPDDSGISAEGPVVGFSDEDTAGTAPLPTRPTYRKPSDVGESELVETLKEHAWQLKPTAEALGVSRASLYLLIESCTGIRKASELGREEIEEACRSVSGDLEQAARKLEVSEQGLKRRMTQLGLR